MLRPSLSSQRRPPTATISGSSSSGVAPFALGPAEMQAIRLHGLQALPLWDAWGNDSLLQRWNAAAAALPAAASQLAAVSCSGPPLMIGLDLETTGLPNQGMPDVVELCAVVATDDDSAMAAGGSEHFLRLCR